MKNYRRLQVFLVGLMIWILLLFPRRSSGQINTSTDETAVRSALETALVSHQTTTYQWKIGSIHIKDEWAISILVLTDPVTHENLPSEFQVALGHKANDHWNVVLPFDLQHSNLYNEWLSLIPDNLISPDARENLHRPEIYSGSTNPESIVAVSGYRLPWPAGMQAKLTSNAESHTYPALDFSLQGTKDIVAAKSGTVKFRKDTSNTNCYDPISGTWTCSWRYANIVVIEHASNEYSWYLHLAQGSIPAGIQEGTFISRGTKIGEQGNTGWSTASHLHFHVASAYDGCCNGSGDTLAPYWPSGFHEVDFDEYLWGDIQTVTQFYTSQNTPSCCGCGTQRACSSPNDTLASALDHDPLSFSVASTLFPTDLPNVITPTNIPVEKATQGYPESFVQKPSDTISLTTPTEPQLKSVHTDEPLGEKFEDKDFSKEFEATTQSRMHTAPKSGYAPIQADIARPASSNYYLARSIMAMGGGVKTSASYRVLGTSGQTNGVSQLASVNYTVNSGFWPGTMSMLGSLDIYLPLVLSSG